MEMTAFYLGILLFKQEWCDSETTTARYLEDLKLKNEPTTTPQKLKIKIFPNPIIVNNRVQLNFSLPSKDRISIQLFNSFGIKVKEIIKAKIYDAGNHQLAINTQNLSTGMYILRIHTKEAELSQKLLLID